MSRPDPNRDYMSRPDPNRDQSRPMSGDGSSILIGHFVAMNDGPEFPNRREIDSECRMPYTVHVLTMFIKE